MPKNIYRLSDGTVVPGCTKISNQLAKEGLDDWIWECGRRGVPWRKERDAAGVIGANVHDMIPCYLNGEEVVAVGEIEDRCFEKFLGWFSGKAWPRLVEVPLVSEKLKFGGQPDYYGSVDGVAEIVDFKTGTFDHKKRCFFETVRYQLAGYKVLLEEHGYEVERCRGVYLPKDNGEVYEEVMDDLRKETRIFKNLLKVYYDRRRE